MQGWGEGTLMRGQGWARDSDPQTVRGAGERREVGVEGRQPWQGRGKGRGEDMEWG